MSWVTLHTVVGGGIYYACTLASNAAKLKFAWVRTIIASRVMVFLTAAVSVALWNYSWNAQRFFDAFAKLRKVTQFHHVCLPARVEQHGFHCMNFYKICWIEIFRKKKSTEENKIHFIFSNFFPDNRIVYEIMWENVVQPESNRWQYNKGRLLCMLAI